jgi:hypothetical protein
MSEELQGRNYEINDLVVVLKVFDQLNQDSKQKLIHMVATHIGTEGIASNAHNTRSGTKSPTNYAPSFSADRSMSVKEFLLEKQPRTEVQRVACLAYYLTHYREQPHFDNLDVSKLNTEAAQIKLSNPSRTIDNALKTGYLVPAAAKGKKQISAAAERFVELLPDHEAARAAMSSFRSRQRRKRMNTGKNEDE